MSANIAASRPNWEPHTLAREEIATVLSNRSAAHLSAGDFIPALVDADVVIALKKPWTKGHFRKAKALVALQCYEEARDSISLGLQFEPDNKVGLSPLVTLIFLTQYRRNCWTSCAKLKAKSRRPAQRRRSRPS